VLAYQVRRAIDLPRELRVRRFNIASGWGDAEAPVGNSPVGEATVGLWSCPELADKFDCLVHGGCVGFKLDRRDVVEV
jgi:hypothetical protein